MHPMIAVFSCFVLLACFSLSVRIPEGTTTFISASAKKRVSVSSSYSASNSSTSASSTSNTSRSTSRPKPGFSSSTSSISSLTSVAPRSSSSNSHSTGSITTLLSSASTTASPSTSSSSSTASTTIPPSTSSSSSTASTTIPPSTSSSSSTTSHPWLPTGSGNSVVVTTTVCCHNTVGAVIGAFLHGGSDGGGVADVGGTLLTIPEGDTDRVIEPPDGGPPELSSVSQPSLTPTTSLTTTSTSTSSSSSTASPSPYVIVPKDGTPPAKEATFQKRLEDLSVEPIVTVLGASDEIDFWTATLTAGNAAAIGDDDVVSYYYLDATLDVDRRYDVGEISPGQSVERRESLKRNEIPPKGYNIQASCKRELNIVSQPPTQPLAPLPPNLNPKDDRGMYYYSYVDSVVPDVWVYLIDDGANPEHLEYKYMRGKKAWSLLADGAKKDDPTSHGSCMLSKIAGPMYGTAKAANVAIIKITKDQEMEKSSMWLRAFRKVLDNVVSKNRQGRAVISFSRSSRSSNQETSHFSEDLYNVLSDLIQQDVVIVCASGNFRTSHPKGEIGKISDTINSIPALFGVPGSTLHGGQLDLLIVGAVDANGVRTQYSQGPADQLGVSAVGNSWCAYGKARDDGTQADQWLTGTSVATAQVAGQVAVMLSNPDAYGIVFEPGAGKTAQKVKEIIREAAYSRSDGEPPVLWNDVDLISCPKRPPGGLRHKRQEDGSSTSTDIPMCAISRISSSTSTMPVTTTSSSSSYTSCPTGLAFQNPGFEAGTFGAWGTTCKYSSCDPPAVAAVNTDEPHTGSYAADISNLASGSDQYYVYFYIYQDVNVCTSGTYTLNFWAMSNDLVNCAGCCTIIPIINGTMVDSNYQISVATSYTQYSVDIGTFSFNGPTTLQIGLVDWNCATQHLYLDDFTVTVS